MKIADLEVNETQKKILTLIYTPRTVYEVAAKLKKSYSSINQNLGILCASKYAVKIKKMSGGVIYKLNKDLEP